MSTKQEVVNNLAANLELTVTVKGDHHYELIHSREKRKQDLLVYVILG